MKIKNPWKLAFIILIGILVGILCFSTIRIMQKRESKQVSENISMVNNAPAFQIQLSKGQANELINFYLEDLQKNSTIKYNFVLDNLALLTGTFNIFGHDVNFYLYLEPFILDDGEVKLKAKSISIGSLSLPISVVLNYVTKNFKLPDWVYVDANNEEIILHLNQYRLKNGMYFQIEKFDLIDDSIQINVHLPEQN